MKKNLMFAVIVTALLMGCSIPKIAPEGKEVKISNKYSSGSIFIPQSSIVSDNATHMIISIDKKDSQAEIRYITYRDKE